MSLTPTYSHADIDIAKVKIGESIYWLKDADLRAIVEAFGTATAKDSTDAVTSTGAALPTESAVYDEIVRQIGALGSVINLLSATDHTAVANPAKGDFVVEADGKEWLYDGTAWREVGSENAYVLKTFELAGIQLSGSSISAAALSSALGLDALAFKASASGTLTNYVTGIEGAEYTPEGSISVDFSQTSTAATLAKADYTPSGDVTVTLSQTATNATLSTADYTPAGSVSVVPSTATFYEVASIGKAPSVSETTGSFATAGITAALDSTDTEMLVFTTASLAAAVTATGFDAGELPSLAANATTFVTGISSASFTGSEVKDFQVTNVAYDKATVSAASFSGAKAESALVTGVTYDKASFSAATFTGSAATITPTLTSDSKAVSVS